MLFCISFVWNSNERRASIVSIGSRLRSERRRNHPESYSMGKGTYSSCGKMAAVMELTTKHQLVPRLRMHGAILLVSLNGLMACCLIRSATTLALRVSNVKSEY